MGNRRNAFALSLAAAHLGGAIVALGQPSLRAQGPKASVVVITVVPPTKKEKETAVHRASRRVFFAAKLKNEVSATQPFEVFEIKCAATAKSIRDSLKVVLQTDTVAVIAPPLPDLAKVVRTACKGKVACVSYDFRPQSLGELIGRSARDHYRARRIAVVHDSKSSKLLKAFQQLPYPCELVAKISVTIKAKKLAKTLAEQRPEVLVLDSEAKKLVGFLKGPMQGVKLDLLLTPRCFDERILKVADRSRIVLGRALPRTGPFEDFVKRYEKANGRPGAGVAEGHDAMALVLEAWKKKKGETAKDLAKSLASVKGSGAHGSLAVDRKLRAVPWTLGFWNIRDGKLGSYVPTVARSGPITGDDAKVKNPDPTLGEVFGLRRSHDFRAAEKTQWVHCRWASGPRGTIDRDLQLIGLSTGGENPLLDRLVKDEIMARILSISSAKFLRTAGGKAIPGTSFNISFTTKLPPKKMHKKLGSKGVWLASFGGDDASAGGRAFGTRCEIYTSFIRRTIFDKHKLVPPIGPEDQEFLDGSYVFGKNRKKNTRSELIRALINGYAGSMALTTAHEVGHLCGLGHVTGNKTAIMDAAEGAGVHHDEAEFCAQHVEKLTKRLGRSAND